MGVGTSVGVGNGVAVGTGVAVGVGCTTAVGTGTGTAVGTGNAGIGVDGGSGDGLGIGVEVGIVTGVIGSGLAFAEVIPFKLTIGISVGKGPAIVGDVTGAGDTEAGSEVVGNGVVSDCSPQQPMADNTKVMTTPGGPIQDSFNDRSTMDGYPNLIPVHYNLDGGHQG